MDHNITSRPSNDKPKIFYGYIIVLISFLALAINNGSRSAFGVFLKPMLADLQTTRGLISGVYSLSLIMNACLNIPAGKLVDKLGPRITITFCGIFMGLGYLLMSQTTAIWQMYLFYGVLIGAGGTIYAPLIATVVRWFRTRRNVMLGIVGIGGSMGTMIFPVFASWLVSVYYWRISFIVLGIIIIIILIVSAQFLRKEPENPEQQASGKDSKNGIIYQSQDKDTSLKDAASTLQFWLFTLLNFAIGFSLSTIMVHIIPYATDQGISATSAASVVSVIGAVGILSRLVLGRIGDRYSERIALMIGLILRLVSIIWLISAKELWMLYIFAVGFGFTFGMGVQITPWISKIFGLRSIGAISGASSIGHNVGFALGPLMAGYIFDNTHSYQWAFIILTITTLVGVITTRVIPAVGDEQKPA